MIKCPRKRSRGGGPGTAQPPADLGNYGLDLDTRDESDQNTAQPAYGTLRSFCQGGTDSLKGKSLRLSLPSRVGGKPLLVLRDESPKIDGDKSLMSDPHHPTLGLGELFLDHAARSDVIRMTFEQPGAPLGDCLKSNCSHKLLVSVKVRSGQEGC